MKQHHLMSDMTCPPGRAARLARTRAAQYYRVPLSLLLLVAAQLCCSPCDAFGKAGLAEFCFDDLTGIKDTGFQTCLQLKQQGHCQTQSYSKFCHKTCAICTDGACRLHEIFYRL